MQTASNGRAKTLKKRHAGDHRNDSRPKKVRFNGWESFKKENERLETYYNGLLGLAGEANEAKREEFWSALRRELPNSFRFCGSRGHALAVQKLLQTRYIPQITQITHLDGQPVTPPEPVPWFPDSLAWSMTTPKNVVRKYPPFAAFQKFLVSETSVGNISRQEVVSMIPPLVMDLRPGMTVLDLCAAPGSKAAQLIELIHRGEESRVRKALELFAAEDGLETVQLPEVEDEALLEEDPSDDGRATGLVIANDSDYKRSHMLTHQLKRLSSPNLVVTNHDATMYPSLRLPTGDPKVRRFLKFDRILADVPCSGDGTLRKNADLWRNWSPASALGLHTTQVRILVRALQMLKPGGRVVYSTCSMNPIENECVVLSAIERCGGPDKVEIIDLSSELPGLKREPGLRSWQIMDKAGRVWNNWDEVERFVESSEERVTPARLLETMFPRTDDDECVDVPIERCIRVYPHLQDTGGFFIAALQKKAEFKARTETTKKPKKPTQTDEHQKANGAVKEEAEESDASSSRKPMEDTEPVDLEQKPHKIEESPPATTVSTGDGAVGPSQLKRAREDTEVKAPASPEKRIKTEDDSGVVDIKATDSLPRQRKHDGWREEPFTFLPRDHPVVEEIKAFYQISPRFPSDRFMVRNSAGEPAKAIYYTTSLVRDLLTCNESGAVKFIHGGVRMFQKQDSPSADVCRWRIQSDGMPIIHGYVGEDRVVHLHDRETLRKLLIEMFPLLSNGGWETLGEIGERVRDVGMGCCVLRVEPRPGDDALEPMTLPLWKSFHSLNLMLPKEDRAAMLLRIFNDTTPLVNNTLQMQKDREAQKAREQSGIDQAEPGEQAGAAESVANAVDADEGANGMDLDLNEEEIYAAEDAPSP